MSNAVELSGGLPSSITAMLTLIMSTDSRSNAPISTTDPEISSILTKARSEDEFIMKKLKLLFTPKSRSLALT